jgi:hypothetical protein
MSLPLEALASEVLRLPTADRIRLLDRVVASLDADVARDVAWDAVAAQRDADGSRDPSLFIPADEVIDRLRSELT